MAEVYLDVRPGLEPEGGGSVLRPDSEQLFGGDDVSPQLLSPGGAFELPQLFERVDPHVRVGADAERDPVGTESFHRHEPVAEICLRRRAEADPCPSFREEAELPVVCVSPVDDRRAGPQAAGVREELDRAYPVLGQALLDLPRLLVGVYVEDEAFAIGVCADPLEPVRRAGTDGVGGDSDSHAPFRELRDLLEVGGDRSLAEAVDPAAGVRHVQEDELHARGAARLRSRLRLLETEVVELADGGVAGRAHLPVGHLVIGSNLLRGQLPGQVEHGVAPAPEIVAFRPPPHGPLKGMAVRIHETGAQEPVWHGREATIGREMATRAMPTPLAQLPNALTIARLAIIPVFVALVIQAAGDGSWPAGILFAAAGLTDQVDGWLARRWGVESEFGRFVDPLADRIIIDAAVILLWYYDRLPWPALALILIRDGVLVVGTPAALRRGYEFSVSFLGKAATWVLYASISFILVTDPGTDWPLALFWCGLALAIVAGALYAFSAWRTTR
jgi:CDP-diacylglycerol---glycerol-3-phosphate 3-phosphatidyltransferase